MCPPLLPQGDAAVYIAYRMTRDANSKPEPPRPQGISLDELAQAFAQVMGTAPKLRPAAPAAAESSSQTAARPADQTPPPDAADETAESEVDACVVSPRSILEAMLFVGNQDNRPALGPGRRVDARCPAGREFRGWSINSTPATPGAVAPTRLSTRGAVIE